MTARLGYDVHGPVDAPVVVLGSSLGTTRAMWDEQVADLSQRFRLVRYDHLGHGESAVPLGPYTVAGLAADLLALMDSLGVERAHVGGLSLGGMVAIQLAAIAPQRVDRLALVCTAAHVPPMESWLERAATVRAEGMGAIEDAVAARWFTPAFAGTERARELKAALRDVPAEGYAGCCEAVAAMDLRPLLRAVKAPVLVVAGAEDAATPPTVGQDIVDAVVAGGGCARLEAVDGAAHLGSVEQAAAVTRLLMHHLCAD